MVTITLPNYPDGIRVEPKEAGALLVRHYGESAVDQEITGLLSHFTATWDEVDRLLAEQRAEIPVPSAEELDALTRLVDYSYAGEAADFERCKPAARRGHIFLDIELLEKYVRRARSA